MLECCTYNRCGDSFGDFNGIFTETGGNQNGCAGLDFCPEFFVAHIEGGIDRSQNVTAARVTGGCAAPFADQFEVFAMEELTTVDDGIFATGPAWKAKSSTDLLQAQPFTS